MDSMLCTRDEAAAVCFSGSIGNEQILINCTMSNSLQLSSLWKTNTDQYYANFLDLFHDELKKKLSHLVEKEMLYQQDNVLVHICVVDLAGWNELGSADRDLAPNMKSSFKQTALDNCYYLEKMISCGNFGRST